ncbi:MAG: DUF2752 domain-containing protein [Leeuwenhoekiella sp.]
MEKYMLPCYTKQWLGFDCMGCGLQRSALLLIKGNFAEAFAMYPAIYPLSALMAITALSFVVKVKYAGTLISALGILSGLFIIVAYIFKLNRIFN